MIPDLDLRLDWLAVIVTLLVLSGLWFSARWWKNWVSILRMPVYLILAWLVLEPTIMDTPRTSGKPSLAVLVDVSRSMGIQDPDGRLESVKKALRKFEDYLEDNFDVSYFEFSQNSSVASFKELMKVQAYGSVTNIYEGIHQVIREKRGDQPVILLFSDGAHNVTKPSNQVIPETPVYTVGLGRASGLSDILLHDFRGSDFAFKGRPVEVFVKVQNFGYEQKTLPVILKEKKEKTMSEMAVKQITFHESSGESEVTFRFLPPAPGSYEYRIEVPLQEGEIAKENNHLDFQLEVGREKMRVLYLCGQPSPEYAFLRQILKSDPFIELVSFVILRNPENVLPVSDEQLSLIQFPAQDIFVRTLPEFDLLIFENFAYGRFNIAVSHLDNIQRFVENRGGGFLMIGGENSFGRGGYQGTAIEKILPVTINPSAESVEDETVSIRLLEPQHPIFDSGASLDDIKKAWKNVPQLNGYHKLPGIKGGASLFAVTQENGLPLIAGWQKGRGRVLSMATLSTWQWALGLSDRGSLQPVYTQFWRQIIRWLTTTIDEKVVRIVLTQTQPVVGKENQIKCIIQPEKLKSPASLEVQLQVSKQGVSTQNLPLTAVGRFEYRSQWIPQSEGTYLISAFVKDGTRKYEDHRTIEINATDLELEDPYPNPSVLKEISHKSGGQYFDLKDFSPEILKDKIKKIETHSVEKIQKTLWTNPWLFSILIFLLLLEWTIRRFLGEI